MVDLARWAIGLAWAVAGGLGFARLRPLAALAAFVLLGLGLALGAASAVRWHVGVYQLVRGWLADAGVYDQRVWFKVVVAGVLAVCAVLLACSSRRLSGWLPPLLRLASGVMVGWALYLFAFTAFLDDLLPAALGTWPGRQLLEGACAATALAASAAAFCQRGTHAGAR